MSILHFVIINIFKPFITSIPTVFMKAAIKLTTLS